MIKKLVIGFIVILFAVAAVLLFTGRLSIPSVMDIYGCTEMFSRYPVDPDTARQNVHDKWNVRIHDDGQARMLVMVQHCEKMVLDYVINVGAVGMSHIWIELEGPEEFVSPLSGTVRSLPTRYWHILPHQLDNRLAYYLFKLVGVDAQFISELAIPEAAEGERPGKVVEGDGADEVYSWVEENQLYAEADIVTGSQRFYRKSGVHESDAAAICESHFLGDSRVTLETGADTAVAGLGFGDVLEGYSNPVWVESCHVNYRVQLLPGD